MKTKIPFILLMFFSCMAVDAQDQDTSMPGRGISIHDSRSFLRNDSLFVHFELTASGEIAKSSEAVRIVPVYLIDSAEISLPEILFNGKSRARFYTREQTYLSHTDYLKSKPYAVLTHSAKQRQRVSYNFSIRLPFPMKAGGRLVLEEFVEDCCDLRLIASLPLRLLFPERVEPKQASPSVVRVYESNVTFIRPQREREKERNEHLAVCINYIVNRYDVLPTLSGNAAELQKVDNVLHPLSSRGDVYRIKSASIKGYTSPEAPYEYNMRLSKDRAEGFKQYLKSRYGLHAFTGFSVSGMGEDWDGLRCKVEESDMPYRGEVLAIIDNVGIFNGREKVLMDLASGDPYRYMFKTFYPSLRRIEMEVTYMVRSFHTQEVETLIKERPQDLSHEEIYDLAQRRNRERMEQLQPGEYGREYDVAVQYFPNDVVALINASSASLIRGNPDETWKYLSKLQNEPRAYNNLGVYYWMRNEIERARGYFLKALSVEGDKQRADTNLRLLEEHQSKKEKFNASSAVNH